MTHWNFSTGELVTPPCPGILIPKNYLLFLAPLLGLAYALFLPFIGIFFFCSILGKSLLAQIQRAAVFSWHPAEAFLVFRKKGKKYRDPR